MAFRVECRPGFDYARASHKLTLRAACAFFSRTGIKLTLAGKLARNGGRVASGFL